MDAAEEQEQATARVEEARKELNGAIMTLLVKHGVKTSVDVGFHGEIARITLKYWKEL